MIKALSYHSLNFNETNQYFNSLPKWKQVLMKAGDSYKPVSLPDHSREACHKALNSLPFKIEGDEYKPE